MASKTNISDYRFSIFINNDQAKKSLIEMEKVMMGYEADLKRLEVEGKKNTQEYKDRKAAIEKLDISMKEMRKEAGLQALSLKELKSMQSQLRNEMARAIPGTEHWKKLDAELSKVNARYRELSGNAKATGLTMSGMADGFNKYFGMLTMGIASVTGLILSFRKLVDTFNDYEKKMDNLSALTGLTGENLDWLSQQAKDLSTSMVEGNVRITQSADAIVDAYTKVGSARPELLKNKEDLNNVTQEAIILSEAANSELQPAVEALAGVLNQFNAPASDARRIINAMAAGSKEGAGEIPYLTEAIEKSGTVAADAGLSYEELIGTIETLAPRMGQPEMAGRSLRAVILKLQEGAKDTNPAIVGMATAIENLGKKNLSVTKLVKLFGIENVTAGKILINNVEELKKYTAAVTGTNVAIEQAAINTDNNSSKLAQAKNRVQLLSIELGEKLAPALTFSTNGFSYLMKAILTSISFFKDHKAVILSVLAAVAAYTVVVYAAAAAQKIVAAATWVVDIAMKALNATTKAGPWGLVIAGIMAATTFLLTFRKTVDETSQAQKKLNDIKNDGIKKTQDETTSAKALFEQLKKSNAGSAERKLLIDQINTTYGTTLKNLSDEKEFLKQLDGSYQSVIESIKTKIALESRQNTLTEMIKQQDEIKKILKGTVKMYEDQLNMPGVNAEKVNKSIAVARKNYEDFIKTSEAELQKVYNEASSGLSSINTKKEKDTSGGGSPDDDQVKKLKDLQKQLAEVTISAIKDEHERELKMAELNHKQKLDEITGHSKLENDLRKALDIAYEVEKEKINKKYSDKKLSESWQREKQIWDAKIDSAEKGEADWYILSVQFLERSQQYELSNTELTEHEKLEIRKKYKVLNEKLDSEFNGSPIENTPDKPQNKFLKAGKDDGLDPVFQLSKRKAALAAFRDQELAANADNAEKQKEIWDDYYKSLSDLNLEFINGIVQAMGTIVSALSGVNQAMSDYENAQLTKDENSNNKKKENLKKQLDSKLITQKKYDTEVAKLDKDLEAKKKELAIKQGKRNKALALAQAIINVAQAVTSALSAGPILGIILAALVGVLGAIQIGYIASTPVPEAARGRYRSFFKTRQAATGRYDVLGQEDKKQYRGIPFIEKPESGIYTQPTLFAETGREIILNPKHTENLMRFRPDLVQAIMSVPQRAGGLYPDTSAQRSAASGETIVKFDRETLEEMRMFREQLKKPLRADMSYDTLTDSMNRVAEIESSVTR
jgi:TP901 family phage tail tape measure protein